MTTTDAVATRVRLLDGYSDSELRGRARRRLEVADGHAAQGDEFRAAEARRDAEQIGAVLAHRAAHGLSWGPGIGPRPAPAA